MKINIEGVEGTTNKLGSIIKKASFRKTSAGMGQVIDHLNNQYTYNKNRVEKFKGAEIASAKALEGLGTKTASIDEQSITKSDGEVSIALKGAGAVGSIGKKASSAVIGERQVSIQGNSFKYSIRTSSTTSGDQDVNIQYAGKIESALNNIGKAKYTGGLDLANVNNAMLYYKNSNGTSIAINSKEYADSIASGEALTAIKTASYKHLEENLIDIYKFKGEREVQNTITLMGFDPNLYIYGSAAEGIVNVSNNEPLKFEEAFGMKLEYTNASGEQIKNLDLLTSKLYIDFNIEKLFEKDADGNLVVKKDAVTTDEYLNSVLNEAYNNKDADFFKKLMSMILGFLGNMS